MARKSIKKNYVYNLIYQLLVLIAPLVTTPYLSRVLGADGIGTASYTESVVSYFTLFATMGMTTFGQREISYVQEDKEKRSIIFWETLILQMLTTAVAICVYIPFSILSRNTGLYFVLIFNILSVSVNVTWFFQGLEEFGKIVIRNVVFKIINIVYIFGVVKSKDDLIWYLLGLSLFTLLSNISLWFSLPKYIDKPQWCNLKPFRNIGVIISLFVPTVAIQIYTVLDKTMIGAITHNSFENGYYEQAIKISKLVLTVVTALGTVMIPRIGSEYGRGNIDEVKRLMYRGYRFVWMLGVPLCLGLISVSSNFVPWFFGEGYEKVIPLLHILSFLILAIGISNVTGMQYLIPTKRQNLFTLTVVIGAITNFVTNLVLINLFESIGAAIASVVAEIVIAVVQIIVVRNEIKPTQILKEGMNYYFAGILMFFILIPLGKVLSPSIINTGIIVVCGISIYSLILLILRDAFFLGNLKLLTNKLFGEIRKDIK